MVQDYIKPCNFVNDSEMGSVTIIAFRRWDQFEVYIGCWQVSGKDLVRCTSVIDLDLTTVTGPDEDGFPVQKVTRYWLHLVGFFLL